MIRTRALSMFVLVAFAVVCGVRVAQADDGTAPTTQSEQTPLAPRFGPLLGGGLMLDADKTPPELYLFGELGGAMRLNLGPVLHGVFEAWFQRRTTSPNKSTVVAGGIVQDTSDSIHYRFNIVGGRLLAGWWVSRPLALRAGVVVGHAWTKLYSDVCGNETIGRAAFGPTFGATYAFGPRKEVEVSILVEAITLSRIRECSTANGSAELTLNGELGGAWVAALGHASYFF